MKRIWGVFSFVGITILGGCASNPFETYGNVGYGNASGNATTTTYGSHTEAIQYNQDRYEYGATFRVKDKWKPVLGISSQGLTPEQRDALKSNKCVSVVAVMKGSSAYKADMF